MFTNVLRRRATWAAAAAALVLAAWAGVSAAQERKPEADKPKDIVATAGEQRNLKTFCKLLQAADLTTTLSGKGSFTVFAPTDAAFDALGKERLAELQLPENKAELTRLLKHHLVDGSNNAAKVKTLKTLQPMAGDPLSVTVKDETVMIDKAKVVKTDIEASNGIIHTIDTVLGK